ncbi:hypothetical protein PV11_07057 [Exophiala sideris]|uniref:Uncharacterized protein n=1 Tax=Exophiala sideris TaxID=1016849 RepID=A0A0D1Y9E4_9EURO|nr:hypothetical protein PV11_07057 [Exophiala sideris]
MIRIDRWWGQSTEVRKRGLKGGRARAQQAKKGKLAACLQDPTPEQNKHRQEVERKQPPYYFITGQQSMAEEVVKTGRKLGRRMSGPITHLRHQMSRSAVE